MNKINIPDDLHNCWEWTAAKFSQGRPEISYGGRKGGPILAARAMWSVCVSAIPKGKLICHTCDNPICVNPSHLFMGTHQDNLHDCIAKGRRPVGEKRGGHKLKNADVEAIKHDSRNQFDIARDYGVSQSLISRIKSGLRRVVSK